MEELTEEVTAKQKQILINLIRQQIGALLSQVGGADAIVVSIVSGEKSNTILIPKNNQIDNNMIVACVTGVAKSANWLLGTLNEMARKSLPASSTNEADSNVAKTKGETS